MTMLDRMRRHKNWLKWSLAIVVVAFVAQDELDAGGAQTAGAVVEQERGPGRAHTRIVA